MKPSILIFSVLLGQILAAVIMHPEKVHQSDEVVLLAKHAVGLFLCVIVPALIFGFFQKKRAEKPGYVARTLPAYARPNRIMLAIVFLLSAAYFCYFDPQLANEDFWPTNINVYTLLCTMIVGLPIGTGVVLFYWAKDKKAKKDSGT